MEQTNDILQDKYPAKAHAKKVATYLLSQGAAPDSVIYLEGQKTRMIEDNDGEAPFRYQAHLKLNSIAIPPLPSCSIRSPLHTTDSPSDNAVTSSTSVAAPFLTAS